MKTAVAQWDDFIIGDKVGDYLNGGIVYEVTGFNAKILSLDQGLNLTWAANNNYELGTDGQSDTDGKANVAAMKAYSLANIGNIDVTKKPQEFLLLIFLPLVSATIRISVLLLVGTFLLRMS